MIFLWPNKNKNKNKRERERDLTLNLTSRKTIFSLLLFLRRHSLQLHSTPNTPLVITRSISHSFFPPLFPFSVLCGHRGDRQPPRRITMSHTEHLVPSEPNGGGGGQPWTFDDYGLLDDISLPSLDWSPSAPLSVDIDDLSGNSDPLKASGSKKRARPGANGASGSKACREKMRRDKLNDRFLELGSVLDPGRPAKVDKAVVLVDAVRMVTQLREEAQKLKDSNGSLQVKIKDLKAEKNELRDEKQKLKTEKEYLERQVKAVASQPSFLPQAPFVPAGQVMGGKLMPLVSYPSVSMWQFMPPGAVDTSQDHMLRPPVA